ncbi:MAG: aspartate kinase [Clostridia bacterium]|nr:aspartate kinase [Clostridia bacterium]
MLKVVKFGGSSLADAEHFRKVRQIIEEDPARRYVVPSAPGKRFSADEKVTDLLYQCYYNKNDRQLFDETFQKIIDRYTQIENDLGVDSGVREALEEIRYEMLFQGTSDYAASRGEYLNGRILAAYLGIPFVDAAKVVVFDENGKLNPALTEISLREKLRETERAVIPGFYGATPSGRIVTFSRGGSDITGSLVAVGVKADLYENWTDVSGCLKADPRVVKRATPISIVTYNELRELSYMGASVMHEEAIYPARQMNIPIQIMNTNKPEDPGTKIVARVTKEQIRERGIVTGIAGKRGFCIITLEKNMMHNEIGFGRKALSVLETNGLSFEHMPSGIDTLSLVMEERTIRDFDQLLADLTQACQTDSIEVIHHVSLIAVVGQGMAGQKGTAARIFTALAKADVNVMMFDQGSNEMNIIVAVDDEDFPAAVNAVYDEFE